MKKTLTALLFGVAALGFSACSSTDTTTTDQDPTVTDGYNKYETEDGKRVTDPDNEDATKIIPDSLEER